MPQVGNPLPELSGLGINAGDARYEPNPNGLLLPVAAGGDLITAGTITAWPSANRGVAHRFICDRTGTLSDVSFFVIAVAGNYDLAVYDTGDTTPAVRTRLYSTGSTAVANAGSWTSVNPNVAVKAGQHLDIGLVCSDATTAAIQRWANLGAGATNLLPSGYLSGAVSASPKFSWQLASALPWASTQAEASCAATQNTVLLIARIT